MKSKAGHRQNAAAKAGLLTATRLPKLQIPTA